MKCKWVETANIHTGSLHRSFSTICLSTIIIQYVRVYNTTFKQTHQSINAEDAENSISYNNQIIHKFITTPQAMWTVIQNVKQSQTSPLCLIVHFGTLLTNYYEMIAEPNAKNVTATPLHTEQSCKAWFLKKMCGSFTPELTTTIHTINEDHQ